MTPEIRLEAIKIAHTLHTDIDEVLKSAARLVHFISGSTPEKASKSAAKTTPASTAATESTQPANSPPVDPVTPTATTAAQQPAASTLSYDEHIKPLIKELAVKARTELLAILKHFNAPKGPDIKPADLPAAKEKLEAALKAATAS